MEVTPTGNLSNSRKPKHQLKHLTLVPYGDGAQYLFINDGGITGFASI